MNSYQIWYSDLLHTEGFNIKKVPDQEKKCSEK